MQIEILDYTLWPLTRIGVNASECYNTKLTDVEHAGRIAKHCINSGHGRNLEFVDINIIIKGISARMARELYTHIGGAPTRLQASTRFINYNEFIYFIPSGMTEEQTKIYVETMEHINKGYKKLIDLGCDNDITGYVLPLAMTTTVCLKMNLRTLENMFNQRLCKRALKEFQDFMKLLKCELSILDHEWKWVSDNLFIPKCAKYGYCLEGKKDCIYPCK